MIEQAIQGILLPLLGTSLGAAAVFILKKNIGRRLQCALQGFAAGVMTAASIWSLLLPAIEQNGNLGRLAFLPAVIGFWLGTVFLILMDRLLPPIKLYKGGHEIPSDRSQNRMLALAVTIHNLPEGMAVGVVYAGYLSGQRRITAVAAMSLALGIAIQNIPEGAIISLPLHAEGAGKGRSFLYGAGSGVIEPVGAVITLITARLVIPAMPYLLGFAAGAMLYVVAAELIPGMTEKGGIERGSLFFAFGFTLMMALDVAL